MLVFNQWVFHKKETAKNLLDKGLDIEFVSEVTGLSIDEIKML